MLVYNLLMLLLVLGMLTRPRQLAAQHPAAHVIFAGTSIVVLGFFVALIRSVNIFGAAQMLAWTVFAHCPLFCIGTTIRLLRARQRPGLAYASAALAACALVAGFDAFLVEPHWIEVTRVSISSAKLQAPLRIAMIADMQSDAPGPYEEHALELAMAEKPDLVLLVGDYIQAARHTDYISAGQAMNDMLRRVGLDAPLGAYAVGGNVDWPGLWPNILAGLPVTIFETRTELDLGPLVLTGLTLEDSFNTALSVKGQDKFHIVVGHSPNFSLGQINADLLIAGHTHGGQIQLPLIGPVLTLSAVPRSWASGVTTIAPDKVLVVSRGIGMERNLAPRLRFLCRPQLVILDLTPPD